MTAVCDQRRTRTTPANKTSVQGNQRPTRRQGNGRTSHNVGSAPLGSSRIGTVQGIAFHPLKDGDETALAAGKTFAREPVFERLWLHATLELPVLRARSEIFTAQHAGRLVGLAA